MKSTSSVMAARMWLRQLQPAAAVPALHQLSFILSALPPCFRTTTLTVEMVVTEEVPPVAAPK
jgi:hypothetical protein